MTQPPTQRGAAAPAEVRDYRAVARQITEGSQDASWVEDAVNAIEERVDLADHRLLTVLALLLDGGHELPTPLREGLERAVQGFRYWMDEPGDDSMCHWSESHQICFAVAEHLAGLTWPETVFRNDGRLGRDKAQRARVRIMRWLGHRFRHGFSEWLSGTFHAIEVSALTLLVEHVHEDGELVARASMVLDLLMLDLALHRFDGSFVSSSGRSEALPKAFPERNEIQCVVDSAFGRTPPPFEPALPTSIFLARRRYRIPQVVREIAFAQADHLVTSSHGLDLLEVPAEVRRNNPRTATERSAEEVALYWGMEAFTTSEAIGPTLEAIERLHLDQNRILKPLMPFRRVPSRMVQTALLRSLNPVTQGAALQRANVQTYRTPHYLLSSAQHYQPGTFGDQENIWQAALPGQIHIFSTHPGSTLLDESARPATPSGWVGNGIRPDVAQMRNVLLALYDTRMRRGYLEGQRHELSHVFFPAANFDELHVAERVVAGRREDSYFGMVSLDTIEMPNESELLQRGAVTGWAVMLADRSDFGSLSRFVDYLKRCPLVHTRSTLTWKTPEHHYSLEWCGDFCVDGAPVDTDYPRQRSDWTRIARRPTVIEVTGRTGTLVLDWKLGTRSQGPGVPGAP
ncbi:hypothetical protein [Luteococcus sp.]|uniref:hypothetical protein n=1 Tax=Luteococcus sp. TaxID=1969402 RepID=UPI003735B41C